MRLRFRDFRELANYASTAWRGFFSEDEIEAYADEYLSEYDEMMRNRGYISGTLRSLADGLYEDMLNDDSDEDVRHWFTALNDLIMRNEFSD